MSSVLSHLFKSPEAQVRLLRARVFWAGLLHDFWKDGSFSAGSAGVGGTKGRGAASRLRVPRAEILPGEPAANEDTGPQIWIADRIQVMEKMWGEGHVLPGNDSYVDSLITPLGMTKEMSVLDLNAGLGGMARKIAQDFGSYVTGFETNPALASRGMVMSVAAGKAKQATVTAYDPENFKAGRKYDCVFARELFYRIKDKNRFFKELVASFKPGGSQLVFTDYLLDPALADKPAIARWKQIEPQAEPLSLHDSIKQWKTAGFDLRVAEDQTELYHQEISRSLRDFTLFLSENIPDAETKMTLLREIDFWARRIAAFGEGLKYYRFYGIKY